ncbi:hypothetical protein WJX72_003195 [[Myrmecia] bisecta]|uniref:ATP-dependent (S)-NAD(P)H-hydrate dehydratase n=1 Tax=[Myrmecia] bisecta TaxID=41462 RepID=A0AAW1Q4F8_9CHLO
MRLLLVIWLRKRQLILVMGLVVLLGGAGVWEASNYWHGPLFVLIGPSVIVAKSCSQSMKFVWALILLPVSRHTVTYARMTWVSHILPVDWPIKAHIILALAGLLLAAVHALSHTNNFVRMAQPGRAGDYAAAFPSIPHQPSLGDLWSSEVALTGLALLTVLAVMVLFAIPRIHALPILERSRVGRAINDFRSFYLTHHLLIAFYALLLIHPYPAAPPAGNHWGRSNTWMWIAVPMLIYAAERLLRIYHSYAWEARIIGVQPRTANILKLRLSCPRQFTYKSGQYIMLKHVVDMPAAASPLPSICLDGPFGAPAQHHERYQVLLMIGSGIGLTPMGSFMRHLSARLSSQDLAKGSQGMPERSTRTGLCGSLSLRPGSSAPPHRTLGTACALTCTSLIQRLHAAWQTARQWRILRLVQSAHTLSAPLMQQSPLAGRSSRLSLPGWRRSMRVLRGLLRTALISQSTVISIASSRCYFSKASADCTALAVSHKGPGRRQVLLGGGTALLAASQSTTQATATNTSRQSSTSTGMGHDDLLAAVKQFVPALTGDKTKGQGGKIATIGGCREYTGAPYFASTTVLKVGADLSHVFCTENAATVIKSYNPELMVHPYIPDEDFRRQMAMMAATVPKEAGLFSGNPYSQDQIVTDAFQAIDRWLERFDAVIIGPGLGRDELVHATVKEVIKALRKLNIPMVIDADGLYIVTHNLDLIKGYKNVILTPNKNEYKRLADALGVDIEGTDRAQHLQKVAQLLDGPTLVNKGPQDGITNGQQTLFCDAEGSKKRAGGQGDVLSGCIAAFTSWATQYEKEHGRASDGLPPLMLAAYGACFTARQAGAAAFAKKRRSLVAGDVIEEVGSAVDRLFDGGDA